MTEDVKPTRAAELELKEKIELAESGHSILEKKRDSLIHEFMDMAEDARGFQGEMSNLFRKAKREMDRAVAFESSERLESISMTVKQFPSVEITSRNIMGVQVPEIESENFVRNLDERGLSLLSSTARIDEAINAFEKLLEKVVEFAETETALIKLLEEIDSTRRRVNALEEKVIPEMKDALNYVSQALEESAREETFRMKKIKEKTES